MVNSNTRSTCEWYDNSSTCNGKMSIVTPGLWRSNSKYARYKTKYSNRMAIEMIRVRYRAGQVWDIGGGKGKAFLSPFLGWGPEGAIASVFCPNTRCQRHIRIRFLTNWKRRRRSPILRYRTHHGIRDEDPEGVLSSFFGPNTRCRRYSMIPFFEKLKGAEDALWFWGAEGTTVSIFWETERLRRHLWIRFCDI